MVRTQKGGKEYTSFYESEKITKKWNFEFSRKQKKISSFFDLSLK